MKIQWTDIQSIKNRFGIIGNAPALKYALQVAVQVANTDLTVLIFGESGVGKEAFSMIIHSLSARKHNPFIAVNCGAIPEGTIDSELFGHEKGSFTGAVDAVKDILKQLTEVLFFLMKLEKCHWVHKQDCCAFWKPVNLFVLAPQKFRRQM